MYEVMQVGGFHMSISDTVNTIQIVIFNFNSPLMYVTEKNMFKSYYD